MIKKYLIILNFKEINYIYIFYLYFLFIFFIYNNLFFSFICLLNWKQKNKIESLCIITIKSDNVKVIENYIYINEKILRD